MQSSRRYYSIVKSGVKVGRAASLAITKLEESRSRGRRDIGWQTFGSPRADGRANMALAKLRFILTPSPRLRRNRK